MAKIFTTAELADRWYDKRDIQNLAGKYVTSILIKQEGEIFEKFFAADEDVCIGFNDGYYKGRDAVKAYFDAVVEATAKKSAFIRGLFPEKFEGMSDAEIFGVGQLRAMPITTPVIEIAEDGATAKGIWHVQGSDNDVTAAGPLSYWTLGYLCIDFIKEGDDWKLWHVFFAEDIRCAMGDNWVSPQEHPTLAGYEAIAEIVMPEYSVAKQAFVAYSAEREFTPVPELPVPYVTFADTFSYGV